MRILAVESSARTASVAIVEDGRLLSEVFTNTGLTHSQTLMPMVKSSLECAQIGLDTIDAFAISNGPGSFTGLRIGVAAIKGMAQSLNKPCFGVSTLEAMAYNLSGQQCIACAVMDARCGQVYTAAFECGNGVVKRLCKDSAIMVSELELQLVSENYQLPIVFVGDGAELCYNILKSKFLNAILASENNRFQRAFGVAEAALRGKNDEFEPADTLMPVYLRVPQAERELRKRIEEK